MQPEWDVLVIGAGAFGLSVARACLARGMSVCVAERQAPGAGASGGLVGALAPHAPEAWDALKALQFDALVAMPDAIAALEAEAGIETGYAQVGRVVRLADEAARARAEARAEAAAERWGQAGRMAVLESPPPAAVALFGDAPMGPVAWDSLTARISPRRYIEALAGAVRRGGEIRTALTVENVMPGRALVAGEAIHARDVVLAAGPEALALAGRTGMGVKGQAALLAAALPAETPVFTAPGLYVVRQGPRHVAVGSTSEPDWTDLRTDARLEAVIEKARCLCPALAHAPVVERWAGLRPRTPSRWPVFGPVPDRPGVHLATGGFKIGLGIAHIVGDRVATMIADGREASPESAAFLPSTGL